MNPTPTKEELDRLGNTLLRLGVHLLLGPGGEYELYRSVPFGTTRLSSAPNKKAAPGVVTTKDGAQKNIAP